MYVIIAKVIRVSISYYEPCVTRAENSESACLTSFRLGTYSPGRAPLESQRGADCEGKKRKWVRKSESCSGGFEEKEAGEVSAGS